jgi:membrane-bound lytic murein transglycosylase F
MEAEVIETSKYDDMFRKAAELYFRDEQGGQIIAWPWLKAQAIAESELNPAAVSPAGAQGLMQIMPGTASMIARKLQVYGDPFDPWWSIMAGAWYDRYLWNIYKKEQGLERLRFVLGAYNSGPGWIIQAQKLARRPDKWEDICAVLHRVTGEDDAPETISYVKKIEKARLQIIDA